MLDDYGRLVIGEYKTGEARLSGGMHELRVRFYQGGGGYGMSARVSGPWGCLPVHY